MSHESISYIANKSKELLATQISSYRSLHQKAGVIIGITSLFAPLFLFLVDKSSLWIKICSAVLILSLFVGILLLFFTLKATKLSQGYDEKCFEDLINEELKYVHKFEIAYNIIHTKNRTLYTYVFALLLL